MLSIDEAIAHAREIAEEQRKDNENCKYKAEYGCKGCADYYSKPCIECAEEHEQLAEWLEELKVYHQHEVICNKGYNAGYNKGINDFEERLIEELSHTTLVKDGYYLANIIKPLAEQLKVGGENER